jgi:type II secretory pathway pseudopilin PulG
MNWKEFLKKYGIYIAGGAVLLYFLLRTKAPASAKLGAGDPELARQELAARTALAQGRSGAEVELARIQAELEKQRLAAAQADAARAAQLLAQQRALEAQQRAQQTSAGNARLQSILNGIASALGALGKAQQKPATSGGGGAGSPGQPPRTQPTFPSSGGGSLAQAAAIVLGGAQTTPVPTVTAQQAGIDDIGIFEPSYQPFEAPSFDLPGVTFDSGYTFNNQFDFPSYSDYYGGGEGTPELGSGGFYEVPDFGDVPTYTPEDFGGLDIVGGGSGSIPSIYLEDSSNDYDFGDYFQGD